MMRLLGKTIGWIIVVVIYAPITILLSPWLIFTGLHSLAFRLIEGEWPSERRNRSWREVMGGPR